ncbi:hypothetical protein [Rhizobium sp.]|uniref:hypothetical protein n=1 Tax=Rhizobium sp. TaxID=391 RepID=UPI003F7E2071
MPRKFVETNGDFGSLNIVPPGSVFMVRCTACGDMREVSRQFLEEKAGAHAKFKDIEARLKCACGEKAAKLMPGYYCVPHPVYDEKTRQWIHPSE